MTVKVFLKRAGQIIFWSSKRFIVLCLLLVVIYHAAVNHPLIIAKTLNQVMPASLNYLVELAEDPAQADKIKIEPFLHYYKQVLFLQYFSYSF